jgi:hypothetical protein
MKVLSHPRLKRIGALMVMLCYVWLSSFGSFLHECVRVPTQRSVAICLTPTLTGTQVTQEDHAVAHNHRVHSCPVCEWQATNVSPALPVFEIVPSFSLQKRVITTFPRYLKTVSLFTSSRAPPLA